MWIARLASLLCNKLFHNFHGRNALTNSPCTHQAISARTQIKTKTKDTWKYCNIFALCHISETTGCIYLWLYCPRVICIRSHHCCVILIIILSIDNVRQWSITITLSRYLPLLFHTTITFARVLLVISTHVLFTFVSITPKMHVSLTEKRL